MLVHLGVWRAGVPSALCGGGWFHLLVTVGNSGVGWLLALIPAQWGDLGGKRGSLQGYPVSSAHHQGHGDHHHHHPFETGSYSLTEAGLELIM